MNGGSVGEWLRRMWYLLNRNRFDDELRREMDAHQAMLGDPARFGSTLRHAEDARDVWGWRWLDDLGQDLRYAARTLLAHRAFTATAALTLALGVGASTAIFSVVNALAFRPLPFPDPGRLVQLHGSSPLMPRRDAVNFLDTYRRESRSFETIAGYEVGARYLRRGEGAERVMAVRGEGDFFTTLGVSAAFGRTFTRDDPPGAVVISGRFAAQHFGTALSALGRTLTLDDQVVTVIGVMPPSFQFPYGAASLLPGVASETRTDIWLPFDAPLRPGGRIRSVTGRLKPGVSVDAADAELKAIANRLAAEFPDSNAQRSVYLEPLADEVVDPAIRRMLFLLFASVALLLALALANVTNLSLARMSIRTREVAVRTALGAGWTRLIRQFLTESLLLSAIGGAAGLAIAWAGTDQLARAAAAHIPRVQEAAIDWRVFAFLLAVCTISTMALGIVPAAVAARDDRFSAQAALQEAGSRGSAGRVDSRLRDGLVVFEIAIACLLSVGATMLGRELLRLRSTDPGLAIGNVLTVHVGHRMTPQTDVRQFYDIAGRVAALPGVRAAGFIQLLPLQNWGWSSNSSDFVVRGRPPVAPVFPIQLRYVTPGYFSALGIPITAGRALTDDDDADAPRVILINQTLARIYFGDASPIGAQTTRGTIAGVVGDVRQEHLDRPPLPELYYPVAQGWSQVSELGMTLVVRAEERPEALAAPVRAIVRQVNPDLAVFNARTMEGVVADSLSEFRLYLALMLGFAALALALALTGTYGVVAYVTSARMKEFAIRMALGADRQRLTRLVLRHALLMAGVGIAIGIIAARVFAPLVAELPVTVRPPDALTVAPVSLFIACVALAACLVPALRAARVSPMAALRDE